MLPFVRSPLRSTMGQARSRLWSFSAVAYATRRPVLGLAQRTLVRHSQGTVLAGAGHDFVHAARMLMQQPSFAVMAVLSLAPGIGVSLSVFSVVDAALLRPFPYAEPERLMAVDGTASAVARGNICPGGG